MSNKEREQAEVMGCIMILILLPASVLLKGFVLMKLWGWFVCPFGIQSITIWHAFGLSILVAMFTSHLPSKKDSDNSTPGVALSIFASGIAAPLIALLAGWLITLGM